MTWFLGGLNLYFSWFWGLMVPTIKTQRFAKFGTLGPRVSSVSTYFFILTLLLGVVHPHLQLVGATLYVCDFFRNVKNDVSFRDKSSFRIGSRLSSGFSRHSYGSFSCYLLIFLFIYVYIMALYVFLLKIQEI